MSLHLGSIGVLVVSVIARQTDIISRMARRDYPVPSRKFWVVGIISSRRNEIGSLSRARGVL